MASSRGITTGNTLARVSEPQDNPGIGAKIWRFLVRVLCCCCPCLAGLFADEEDRTSRQDIETRDIAPVISRDADAVLSRTSGENRDERVGLEEYTSTATLPTGVSDGRSREPVIVQEFLLPNNTGLPHDALQHLVNNLNHDNYLNLRNHETAALIEATLTEENTGTLFGLDSEMSAEAFSDKYLLFLLLHHEHALINENYLNAVFFTPPVVSIANCLVNPQARDQFYHNIMELYPNLRGVNTQPERRAERQIPQAIVGDSSDVEGFSNDLKNLVRIRFQTRRYEDIRLTDEQLNYALDPCKTATLLSCIDTENSANAFIAFLYLRNEYPQLNFDCFQCVGLLMGNNPDQYINDANARRLLFEEQIKNNRDIMDLGGYRHEWVRHQRLNRLTSLEINNRCMAYSREFMLSQELLDSIVNTLTDEDLNNTSPQELADQIECFVRLRSSQLPDGHHDIINPVRFNEIRGFLPRHIDNLRSRHAQLIHYVCFEINRDFQARNQNEVERVAGMDEGRMNSLMTALGRSPDQSLEPDSVVQEEIAPSQEDSIRDSLINDFQPYLQVYGLQSIDRDRLLQLVGCVRHNNDTIKIKYVIAFLLIQRENADLTDENFAQLVRDDTFRRLLRQAPLSNKNIIREIHFVSQLTREELQQCADVLLNHLNQSVQSPSEVQDQARSLSLPASVTSDAYTASVVSERDAEVRTRRQTDEIDYLKQELQDHRMSRVRAVQHEIAIFRDEAQHNSGDVSAVEEIIATLQGEFANADLQYNALINNDRLPITGQYENGRIETRCVAGVQATNNNCGLASVIMSLNSQGLLPRMIEMAERNESAPEELLDILRHLVQSSEHNLVHDRYLVRLRELLGFRQGITLEMPDIMGELLTNLGFQTWGNMPEMTSYQGPAPIQFIPLFTYNSQERSIEDAIQETYRQNLNAHPVHVTGETRAQRAARIENSVLTIPAQNKPEMIFATYPAFGYDFRVNNRINNEIVMLDDNGIETPYSLVALISNEGGHYLSWNIDQENNRVTFSNSMSIIVHGTNIPGTVTVQGVLSGSDVRQPLFSAEGARFLRGIKQRRDRAIERLYQADQNRITLAPGEREQLQADRCDDYGRMIDTVVRLNHLSTLFVYKRKDI